ncbi:MAG: tetratricopeptide repeat protein [Bacteroidota bacterium]
MAKEKKDQLPSEETLANNMGQKSITEIFEENKNTVTYLLVGLLVVVAGYILYRQLVQVPKEKMAIEQMVPAQLQFERDSFAQALTNPGGPDALGFADLAKEYSGTKVGNLSLYYAGVSCLQLGQFDAAIDYLEDFSPAGDITPTMKAGALGDAYSEKSDFGKALSLYEKASGNAKNPLLAAYYLKKYGMLSERQGDKATAMEAYQTIKEEYFNTPVANDIDKFIVRVKG